MQIVSLSTLPVGGYAWRPRCGGHAFVVIAKATFELTPEIAQLAATQDGLNESDNHWDDDETCSVYAPSDMAPFKERADVTLVGNAHAPTPAGARTAIVRMSVAGMDKKVAVFCDRQLDKSGRVVEGKPFKSMALRYERAAGGRLSDNPVGVEPATKANRSKGPRRLPNLQPHAGGRRPAGFGPLGARWPMRKRLLRSVAKQFSTKDWRQAPLPAALDCTYFNDAPRDQRVDALRSDERIVLENVHPRHTRLATRLPGVEPRAFVEMNGSVIDVALSADSLWIDMTRGVCTVTWRGSFEIAHRAQAGRVLVALQQPGEELTYTDILELQRPRSERTSSVQLARREQLHTLDLAVGAESYHHPSDAVPLPFIEPAPTETLVAHAPVEALPFSRPSTPPPVATSAAALPSNSPGVESPGMKPPSIAPPSTAAPSPWIGKLSARNHEIRLPKSNPQSITPPPLMLVPPPSAPPQPKRRLDDNHRGSLAATHRIDLIGNTKPELDRVQQQWRDLSDEAPADRLDRELREAFGDVDSLAPADARRNLVRIMTTSDACDLAGMREAMMDAVDEDGVFEAPLILTHGVMQVAFDRVATLRATMAAVATYLKEHEALREEVESARDILALQTVAPDAAADLTDRIRSTFDDTIDVAMIDARVERMLLDDRAYQTKKVLGAELVRATVRVNGEVMPCYLPREVADVMPLFTELTVRVIAELHPRQDQHEESPRALRTIALGRVIARQEEC